MVGHRHAMSWKWKMNVLVTFVFKDTPSSTSLQGPFKYKVVVHVVNMELNNRIN